MYSIIVYQYCQRKNSNFWKDNGVISKMLLFLIGTGLIKPYFEYY